MRVALTIAALAALAACGTGTDEAGPERRDAAGKVLGGEVTDDMLPLDSLRSTSPVEPRRAAPGEDGTGNSSGNAGESATPGGDPGAPGDGETAVADSPAEPPTPAPSDE